MIELGRARQNAPTLPNHVKAMKTNQNQDRKVKTELPKSVRRTETRVKNMLRHIDTSVGEDDWEEELIIFRSRISRTKQAIQ